MPNNRNMWNEVNLELQLIKPKHNSTSFFTKIRNYLIDKFTSNNKYEKN
jgi:hypothetical protein